MDASQNEFARAVLEAFEPYANPRAPGLLRALAASRRYASVEGMRKAPPIFGRIGLTRSIENPEAYISSPGEIIIDKTALLSGIIDDGKVESATTSSSDWLAEWLTEENISVAAFRRPPSKGADPEAAFKQGAAVKPSISLVNRVLPAALTLAKATVGRDKADLRHVLFALLDEPPSSFDLAPGVLTPERIASARRFLVARITASPEKGEKVDVWRKLADQRRAEIVGTLTDAPAVIDSLGRKTFAEVLASRIRDVGATLPRRGREVDAAFILHMDGPWGSGKSSILNFLKADLEKSRPRWLVVEFNAWRHQHRRPAWLPLILEVRSAAIRRLTVWTPLVWAAWFWWRLRLDWLPYVIAVLLISTAGFLVWWSGFDPRTGLQDTGEALKTVGAIIATVASFLAVARGFALGSQRNAETYFETKSHPFRRIIRYFRRLVRATHRPVAVFVDDLDRCDGNYVIDLLEGIQTSLRAAPIVYVVAGDRHWICSSFEKRYADFASTIGTPGRPLGYLFLDKVFQLSTSVPQLSSRRQAQFWRQLLSNNALAELHVRNQRAKAEADAAAGLEGKTHHEEFQSEIDKTDPGSVEREAMLAAAARRTATADVALETEHRLQAFAPLLEANPRSMKRLVNAYGLNQARAFLEDRRVSVEALARWTIIELRWPVLADHVARQWPQIDLTNPGMGVPEPFAEMLKSTAFQQVVGSEGEEGRLTKENLGPILGDGEEAE